MSDALPPGPTELPAPRACLVVLDGWGMAPDGPGNAVSLARTPVFDELWRDYPHTQLKTWGRYVGLPDGQMGNSEVGHLNLGAGAVVMQDLTRIDDAAAGGALAENAVLREAFTAAPRVHLIGLVSHGGVHSSVDHLRALVALAATLDVPDLVIHAFTDGRDTLPHAGAECLDELADWCARAGHRAGGDGGRALLRDGPRPPLGPHAAGLRPARGRSGAPPRGHGRRGRARRLRAGRDGRVHRADDCGGGGAYPRRRQRAVLQLPPRSRAPDHARAGRAGIRRGGRGAAGLARAQRAAGGALRLPHRVRGGLALPGGVHPRRVRR